MQEIESTRKESEASANEEKKKEKIYKMNVKKLTQSYQHPFEHEDKSIYQIM